MQQPFNKKNLRLLVVRHHDNSSAALAKRPKSDAFHRISLKISNKLGSAWAFYIAVAVILAWTVSGPFFNFSDTWQLVINTGTTIVTFLMVFVIQNTQNRDSKAMQLKLD
jgi:low affinity Fe/Cu permease